VVTTKVLNIGSTQLVRIPEPLCFAPEVCELDIRRDGDRLILAPLEAREWPETFWAALEGIPEDFERPEQVPQARDAKGL